ncbi:hypothetical protein SEA_HENOCCUS_63 [Streptomyces phage Henoccus]|nr:hypothetical protein SEA_HENOCCUS_63 [Streptomyces phage Henoccus]
MIKAQCDRCGHQEPVEGAETARIAVMLPPPFTAKLPKLPADWRRVTIPAEDEAVQHEVKELCGACVNALRQFFQGDGAVPGLLEPETLDQLTMDPVALRGGCTCPQPQEPRPPCPLHEQPTVEDVAEMLREHRPEGCIGHGGPDCVCEDPRPNLTERARKLAGGEKSRHCTCAGVGFGTEDCAVHHPDGLEKGTHLKCYQDPDGRECPGIYRRGMFVEHMDRWHGIPVDRESKPCPYCGNIESGIMKLGQHIAADHPGHWQAWIDGGQQAG